MDYTFEELTDILKDLMDSQANGNVHEARKLYHEQFPMNTFSSLFTFASVARTTAKFADAENGRPCIQHNWSDSFCKSSNGGSWHWCMLQCDVAYSVWRSHEVFPHVKGSVLKPCCQDYEKLMPHMKTNKTHIVLFPDGTSLTKGGIFRTLGMNTFASRTFPT